VTGSTNLDARAWADSGAPEGALIVADQQTDGRGRAGRVWESAPGKALLFSLILRPRLGAPELGLLTSAAGVAVAEGLEQAAGLSCRLKWPNDVLVGSRKIAGILVESVVQGGETSAAIVGVGVNTHWEKHELPDELAERATSIAIECVEGPPLREEVLAAVLHRLEVTYDLLYGDPHEVVARATRRSSVLNRRINLKLPGGDAEEVTAVGLAHDGALIVEGPGGRREVYSGEVERVLPV
jgi:BirA family biotin operon repressor/biotin-[acetyl-CoA-carboxylase] ligase